METSVIVLNSQSLLDIAIRYLGTVEAALDIAVLNKISITEDLVPGQILELPNVDYGYQEIVTFFNANKTQPATALSDDNKAIIEGDSGIGFWTIEDNFIVQ
ncbi:hypothetical protein [Flavobacterium frigoris]|uniref:LysM domain-containing protein n=1 Tax=Flavobacterium frigoris TaxID=229204 RepID=A0A1H9LMA2_FLAFI|nr:hypothetical protein [Flavobacterium frigoris]SER12611.1 hypothetical protein SAMN05444355_10775 [Flavobacterium frigoris]